MSRPWLSKTGVAGDVVLPAANADGTAASASRAATKKRLRLTRRRLVLVSAERPELVTDEVERRDEDDRDCLADDLLRPGRADDQFEQQEVRHECRERDDEEPHPLDPDVPPLLAERPDPVQDVV